MTKAETQKQLMLLRRSLRQLHDSQLVYQVKEPRAKRVKRFSQRCRVKSVAGCPVKAGLVREELYDWFLPHQTERQRPHPARLRAAEGIHVGGGVRHGLLAGRHPGQGASHLVRVATGVALGLRGLLPKAEQEVEGGRCNTG